MNPCITNYGSTLTEEIRRQMAVSASNVRTSSAFAFTPHVTGSNESLGTLNGFRIPSSSSESSTTAPLSRRTSSERELAEEVVADCGAGAVSRWSRARFFMRNFCITLLGVSQPAGGFSVSVRVVGRAFDGVVITAAHISRNEKETALRRPVERTTRYRRHFQNHTYKTQNVATRSFVTETVDYGHEHGRFPLFAHFTTTKNPVSIFSPALQFYVELKKAC